MLKHNTVNMVHNALEHSHCGVNFTTEDSDQLKHVKEMQIIQREIEEENNLKASHKQKSFTVVTALCQIVTRRSWLYATLPKFQNCV